MSQKYKVTPNPLLADKFRSRSILLGMVGMAPFVQGAELTLEQLEKWKKETRTVLAELTQIREEALEEIRKGKTLC